MSQNKKNTKFDNTILKVSLFDKNIKSNTDWKKNWNKLFYKYRI